MWLSSPRLMLLGAIPALIVGICYLGGMIVLLLNLDALANWITPFAEEWTEPWRGGTRIAAAIALTAAALVLAAYSYAVITLLVGDPFYERIWRTVEVRLGDAPADSDLGFLRSIRRAIADGLRLALPALLLALGVLICGFLPIVGSVLGLVLGTICGGWLLALELTGFAFEARGFSLRERRRILGIRRSASLGFGAASYLLFLVPIVAVIAMPAAVAGAAMLSRDAIALTPAFRENPREGTRAGDTERSM